MCAHWSENRREIERAARRARRRGEPVAPDLSAHKPKTRGDCSTVMRPCPWVSCRYHLFLDARPNGTLSLPHGDDPEMLLRMPATCALDVAAEGARTLDQVAEHFNVTRERLRQIEEVALAKFQEVCDALELRPGAIVAETAYERSPVDTTLEALGLAEEASWIKRLWSRQLMHGEKPSPPLMTGSE